MSLVFNGSSARQGVPDSTSTVQKLLDENSQLIAKIKESQDQGKINEALPYQNLLHGNLVYLAKAADRFGLKFIHIDLQLMDGHVRDLEESVEAARLASQEVDDFAPQHGRHHAAIQRNTRRIVQTFGASGDFYVEGVVRHQRSGEKTPTKILHLPKLFQQLRLSKNRTSMRKELPSREIFPKMDKHSMKDLLEMMYDNKKNVAVSIDETMEIGGVPLEHQEERTARILRPAREATQTPWNNTKAWRIELDNRHRWENPLIGWTSSGDPLSNTSMMLKFASQEDAIPSYEGKVDPVYIAKAADHSLLKQLEEEPTESSQSQIPAVVEPPQPMANQNAMGGQQMMPQMGMHSSQVPMNPPSGMGPPHGYPQYHQGPPANFGAPNSNPYEQQMMYQQQLPPGQQPPYMHPR